MSDDLCNDIQIESPAHSSQPLQEQKQPWHTPKVSFISLQQTTAEVGSDTDGGSGTVTG